VGEFRYQGQRIAYTEFAARQAPAAPPVSPSSAATPATTRSRVSAYEHPLILVHGLLLGQSMHLPLAEALAERGSRVINVDLLGHGESDRPRDLARYSMTSFAEQVVALMDHLELDQAAAMGTSLGANVVLEMASLAPARLRGLVIEMPVLDDALVACALVFSPLLVALSVGGPVMRGVQRAAQAIPRRLLPHYGNVVLDTLRQDPGPGAAVLQGLYFGRIAPPRSERRTFQTPALVIGHRRDPVHPFSDAGTLASEMPNAELLIANSMLELRFSPARLTDGIAGFLDRVWDSPQRERARGEDARGTVRDERGTGRAKPAAGRAKPAASGAKRAAGGGSAQGPAG
jgi:pimeloyl-ACP methyl ester carboxylesterase